jgi:hypothetical protein
VDWRNGNQHANLWYLPLPSLSLPSFLILYVDAQSWATAFISYLNGGQGANGGPTFGPNEQGMGWDWWAIGPVSSSLFHLSFLFSSISLSSSLPPLVTILTKYVGPKWSKCLRNVGLHQQWHWFGSSATKILGSTFAQNYHVIISTNFSLPCLSSSYNFI